MQIASTYLTIGAREYSLNIPEDAQILSLCMERGYIKIDYVFSGNHVNNQFRFFSVFQSGFMVPANLLYVGSTFQVEDQITFTYHVFEQVQNKLDKNKFIKTNKRLASLR